MNETKPTLSSKTIITNLILAVINALVLLGVISADLGLSLGEAAGALAGLNIVGNLISSYFRKTATAKLG